MHGFLKNKVVAVRGGSDRIGKAIAGSLLARGTHVSARSHYHDKLYELQFGYPLIACAEKMLGEIEILIDRAGTEVFISQVNINFSEVLYCTKYALNPCKVCKIKITIAGISTIAGRHELPEQRAYSASKYAVNGWPPAVSSDRSGTDVHMMWVYPGSATSNIYNAVLEKDVKRYRKSLVNPEKIMNAETYTLPIINAIEKKKQTFIFSSTGKRTVFMNNFFPSQRISEYKKFYFKTGMMIK